MRRLLSLLVFAFFSLFWVASPSFAQSPRRYYDWNNYSSQRNNVLGVQVFAQEKSNEVSPSSDYKEHNYVLGFTSNFTPNNPFYFVKKFEEGVSTALSFDKVAREKLRLELAGERLKEMEQMNKKGSTTFIPSTADSYKKTVERVSKSLAELKEDGVDVKNFSNEVDLEAAKHTIVLEQLVSQVPTKAVDNLKNALIASEKTVDTAADVLGRPAVPQEVVERLQALKAQGILSTEEVAKLIGVKSRQEAREELRKYAENRLIPQADFKKLDETARNNFPAEYFKALELKKFEELKELETQKPDDQTLAKLQEFAKNYKPGESVPSDLRRWWVPMVRLEELQNTIRPDLIQENFFRYRPDDQQKYKELVERLKPREEDIKYVDNLIKSNPNVLNDPSYARIKALADKFGTTDNDQNSIRTSAQNCGADSHWVYVPFMPNGGYCVPNIVYVVDQTGSSSNAFSPCPPGYHRNDPQGACYPNSSQGPGLGGILTAPGTCPSGYKWFSSFSNAQGGYCSPEYSGVTGGTYPHPIAPPAYCPAGQAFMDGKCQPYNLPPETGCPSGQIWNGSSCITYRDCGRDYYQGADGTCKPSSQGQPTRWDRGGTSQEKIDACKKNPPTCKGDDYVDYTTCSCMPAIPAPGDPRPRSKDTSVSPGRESQEAACRAGGGTCTGWNNGACSCTYGGGGGSRESQEATCRASGGTCTGWYNGACSCERNNSSTTPSSSSSNSGGCGSGYTWNGNYCVPPGGVSSGYYSPPSYTGSNETGSGYTQPSSQTPPPSTNTSASAPPPSQETSAPPPPPANTTSSESSPPPPSNSTTSENPPPPSGGSSMGSCPGSPGCQ